jgi:hypothetical protein
MKKTILLSILISFLSCKKAEDNPLEDKLLQNIPKEEYAPQTIEDKVELPEYSLIKKADISHRTSTDSDGSINKRFSFKYLVSDKIIREQIKPLFTKLIKDIISEDADLDDVTIWLYSDKNLISGSYDVAMATWSPEIGGVTKDIAVSNNRDSYKLVVTIADNLEEHLKVKPEKVVDSGLGYDLRKKIYQELANTETRARAKLDKIYPYTANFDTDNYANKLDELTQKFEKEISKKYKIDSKTIKSIYEEGDKNGWFNL